MFLDGSKFVLLLGALPTSAHALSTTRLLFGSQGINAIDIECMFAQTRFSGAQYQVAVANKFWNLLFKQILQ